jgi:hypothetical protein
MKLLALLTLAPVALGFADRSNPAVVLVHGAFADDHSYGGAVITGRSGTAEALVRVMSRTAACRSVSARRGDGQYDSNA